MEKWRALVMGGRQQGPIKALVPSRTAEECHVALNRPDTVMMTGAGYKDQTRCPQLPCTVCIHIHLHVHIFIRSILMFLCVYTYHPHPHRHHHHHQYQHQHQHTFVCCSEVRYIYNMLGKCVCVCQIIWCITSIDIIHDAFFILFLWLYMYDVSMIHTCIHQRLCVCFKAKEKAPGQDSGVYNVGTPKRVFGCFWVYTLYNYIVKLNIF